MITLLKQTTCVHHRKDKNNIHTNKKLMFEDLNISIIYVLFHFPRTVQTDTDTDSIKIWK